MSQQQIWDELEEILAVDDVKKFTAHSFYTNIPPSKWHMTNTKRGEIRDTIVYELINLEAPQCLDALLDRCLSFDLDYSGSGFTPVAYAISVNRGVECVKVLFKHAKRGLIHVVRPHLPDTAVAYAPLDVALSYPDPVRSLEIVTLIVDHRPLIDLNERTLNYLNNPEYNIVSSAIIMKHYDVARFLIAIGDRIDLTTADIHGCTALHHAAKAGITDIVIKLLRAGADRTVKNKAGQTPSQYAFRVDIKFLIDTYGPDVASDDFDHDTEHDDLMNDVHLMDLSDTTVKKNLDDRMNSQIRKMNNNPNSHFCGSGLTVIQFAITQNFPNSVIRELLLVDDLDLSVKSGDGRTAIDMAVGATKDMLIEFANQQELKKRENTKKNNKTEKSNQQTSNAVEQLSTSGIQKAATDVTNPVEELSREKPAEPVSLPKEKMIADSSRSTTRSCRQCHSESVQVNIVLLPCNHVCMCEKCGEEARKNKRLKCPICKQIVRQYMRVRF